MNSLAASILCLASACGESTQPIANQSQYMVAHGLEKLPAETMTDWVSYADIVARVTVTSERMLAPGPEVGENGEGYVPRAVGLSVNELLWVATENVKPGAALDMVAPGWWFTEGQYLPICIEGGERLEPKSDYIVPLVRYERGWAVLAQSAIVSSQPQAAVGSCESDNQLVKSLRGVPSAEIRERIAQAPRDADVERNRSLPPVERYELVESSRRR